MELEKKLVACSILALTIGVSSVLPLMFLMATPVAKADPTATSWFSVNIPYAYWTAYNGPLQYPDDYPFEKFETNAPYSVSNQYIRCLNFTLNEISTVEPFDARVEYYQMSLSSDKEHIINMNYFLGIYDNSTFSLQDFNKFHFGLGDRFDTVEFNPMPEENNMLPVDGDGIISDTWAVGQSILDPSVQGGTHSTTDPNVGQNVTTPLVSALREAETLFITVRRIGWVTFRGNSTVVTLADNEIVKQIQLDKVGEASFLYNDLIPEEELTDYWIPLKTD